MATNKNQFIRYKILDNCFRNPGKRYFIEDLMKECEKALTEIDPDLGGISRRQIFSDISFMESSEGWGIELERLKDGKKVYYRYVDTDFSINQMPLNEVEINQLKSALEILSQFKGMPQFEWINELIPKLRQGIGTEGNQHTIIEFDNNNYLKGIENLGKLYNAIYYKKVLRIDYKPFENVESFEIVIHPYYLKQYNNRWFLFGYNDEMDKYDWNLALDRIQSIDEITDNYRENNSIDWSEYFEDIIGVTKPMEQSTENIILHFYGKTGNYIESKPIHGSQRSNWMDANTLEVKLELIINYEFIRLILSYAESVKVISPEGLTNAIKSRLGEASNLYSA
ncbi:MAG: WYL domain-containing protein [Flavobacteriales bacterium]|nr:WYL domain-containing protein [Flavobacteriales bacterium]